MELSKQKNYQQAFDLACSALRETDLKERAEKSGALYQKGEREEMILHVFSEPYHIVFPQIEIYGPGKKVLSLVARAVLLHYLLQADGSRVTGDWVGYKDIPGGLLYAGVFARRVTEPLVKKFGRSAKAFMEAGIKLGAKAGDVGNASLIFQGLPRVPIQYVLWEGDEEFPPHVQLLFDASVDHYLSLEDIVVLGQMVTARLIHASAVLSRE